MRTSFGYVRAQPDIGQPCLGQNAEAELDRPLHDQQIGHIGQDMFDRDPRRRFTSDPRGEENIAFALWSKGRSLR